MKKNSALRRTVNVVGIVIMLVLAGILAYVSISSMGGNLTFLGGYAVLWVKTDSMEPFIPAQSYVLMEKVDPYKVKVKDVILFVSEDPTIYGQLNTHQVVAVQDEPRVFTTKGVNNIKEDKAPVPAENVRARYVCSLPLLSVVGRLMTKPIGITLMIAFMLALTAAAFLPDLMAGFGSEKRMKQRQVDMDERVRAEVERMKAEAAAAAAKQEAPADGKKEEALNEEPPTDQKKEEEE